MKTSIRNVLVLSALSAAILTACGGGGGSGTTTNVAAPAAPAAPTAPAVPVLNDGYDVRQLVFSWPATAGVDTYNLYVNMGAGFVTVPGSANLPANTTGYTHYPIPVHLYDWSINGFSYLLEACNAVGCTDSAAIQARDSAQAIGYFQGQNTESADNFGFDVAMSGDGMRMVVGARDEESKSINDPADNSLARAGAAYVFADDGDGNWTQEAYLKASDAEAEDQYGRRVAISQDGSRIAVAAHLEDTQAPNAGAVYVYTRGPGGWGDERILYASNAGGGDFFGHDLALSADGNTVIVGSPLEDGADNGTQDNIGAIYVYTWDGVNWVEDPASPLRGSNSEAGDVFGWTVAISDDGSTAAVTAIWEDGDDGGLQDQSGAVYTFTSAAWAEQAYLKPTVVAADAGFGESLALSEDGSVLAVGANGEDGGAGAAYVLSGALWVDEVRLTASNAEAGDQFGSSIALNNSGELLSVSAVDEDSPATGINGSEANGAADSGAAYVFVDDGGWSQYAYVKPRTTTANDQFGASISLSDLGDVMAVGAYQQDLLAGAVYLY